MKHIERHKKDRHMLISVSSLKKTHQQLNVIIIPMRHSSKRRNNEEGQHTSNKIMAYNNVIISL